MLILTRRYQQSITIGHAGQVLTGPIVVAIADIRGSEIRLGIDCQRDLRIHRSECVADTRDERKPTDRTESD